MENRPRKVECDACNTPMRSDTLKRQNNHKDLLSLPKNEVKHELKIWQEYKKKQEEKIQNVLKIARENNLSIPEEIISKNVNLLRILMMFEQDY